MLSKSRRFAHALFLASNTGKSATAVTAMRTYHEKVIDHYENPRNVGSLDKNDPNVGTGIVGAPACGDVMKLQIKVDENGKIVDAKFKTFGCGSAIASSSLATEWIKGKSTDLASKIKNKGNRRRALPSAGQTSLFNVGPRRNPGSVERLQTKEEWNNGREDRSAYRLRSEFSV
ncbi:iron-sulfur cluster assembly protein 1 [Ditylenchus destructor]|uniref:Iron-sulfur cluster assembly protein 1 n=1 Tax=Ditylenchus destructor TaxID=166010 RepID=A0AAD4MPZ4_9BILA|nr:iron-sulfur cluster assembly protein 1 [Ditylenchus destructor]